MIFYKTFDSKCVFLIHLLCYLHSIKCNEFADKLDLELWYRSAEIGPCSEYFHYLRVDDFIIGNLTLPNMKIGDTVKLAFDQNHANFNGSLLLDASSGDVMERVQNRLPLFYRVDFPPSNDVPRLRNISINCNVLCAIQFDDFEHSSNTFILQHTLDFINKTLPIFTHNINIPSFVDGPTCGNVDVEIAIKGASTSAYGGTRIRRGEYPWLVSIYYIVKYFEDEPRNHVGALLSSKFVLSEADFFDWGIIPGNVVITLGRYNLSNMKENSFVSHVVETLILSPDHILDSDTGTFDIPDIFDTENKHDAGLVLLKMKNPVTFTQFIKPICLWNEPADESIIVNQTGVVVGWKSWNEAYDVPIKIRYQVTASKLSCSNNTFLRNTVPITKVPDMKIICTESRYGADACDMHGNGGLNFYRNGRWFIRGVFAYPHSFDCNGKVINIDLAQHISWLRNYIDEPQPMIESNEEICGSSSNESLRSEHPWLAAIYRKMYTGVEFSCTGALLSRRTVLVNADCLIVQGRYRRSPDFFRIYIGRYDLNDIHQNGVTTRDVETLVYHPNFKPSSSNFQDNSIVILQMKTPVIFTQYVKPICLWKESANQTEIMEENATLAGWEVESSNTPISIAVNITSKERCQTPSYNVSTSTKILCVAVSGTKNHGILMMKQNERWLLRGVTSAKTFMPADFWVYSDIAEFQLWIQNNILP